MWKEQRRESTLHNRTKGKCTCSVCIMKLDQPYNLPPDWGRWLAYGREIYVGHGYVGDGRAYHYRARAALTAVAQAVAGMSLAAKNCRPLGPESVNPLPPWAIAVLLHWLIVSAEITCQCHGPSTERQKTMWHRPGGATTTGPDATPPSAICQNLGGGGGGGGAVGAGGGSAGGWGGVLAAWPGGGAARNPLLSHAYLKGVSGGHGGIEVCMR